MQMVFSLCTIVSPPVTCQVPYKVGNQCNSEAHRVCPSIYPFAVSEPVILPLFVVGLPVWRRNMRVQSLRSVIYLPHSTLTQQYSCSTCKPLIQINWTFQPWREWVGSLWSMLLEITCFTTAHLKIYLWKTHFKSFWELDLVIITSKTNLCIKIWKFHVFFV